MAEFTFNKSSLNSSGSYIIGKIVYNVGSTNIANNTTSSVEATLYVKKGNDSMVLNTQTSGTWSYTIEINGNKKTGTLSANVLTSWVSLGSYTISNIPHNNDGTKTITIAGTVTAPSSTSYSGLKSSGSKSVALTTIPRASSITSAADVSLSDAGASCSVKWTPLSAGFAYKLKFVCGGVEKTTGYITPNKTTAYTYTGYSMKVSEWAQAMPKAYSATCTVTLYTYQSSSSTTSIGSSSKTFTLTLPDTIQPTITFNTAQGVNTWTTNSKTYYLQGISQYKLDVTFTAGAGSYISSCSISGSDLSLSSTGSTSTTSKTLSGTSSVLSKTDKQTYTAKVIDGRTNATLTKTITVYAYSKPSVSLAASRTTTSGSVKLTYKASCASVNSQNALKTLKIYKKLSSASSWTVAETRELSSTSNQASVTLTGFDPMSSYDFYATVSDTYSQSINQSTTSAIVSVGTDFRLLNINASKKGLALGKMSQDDTFDCNLPMKISNSTTIESKAGLHITNSTDKYLTITRTGLSNGQNVRGQIFVEDDGDVVFRRRYSTDGTNYANQGQLTIQKDCILISDTIKTSTVQATYGRFTSPNDANPTQQNQVALIVGDAEGEHLEIDQNEIIAKDDSTTEGIFRLTGNDIQLHINDDDIATFRVYKDEKGNLIRSVPTYSRTYDNSPNVYIASSGAFGRSTSSSMRYKKDITDVLNEDLNPYRILQIPVREYKYREEHIPIGKQADDVYIGLIAEEVAEVYPIAAEYAEDGQIEMWNIKALFPALLKIVQDQQKEIEAFKKYLSQSSSNNEE